MRWLGQAQRAFDLLCTRLNSRSAFGEPLAAKQLMQQHVFESYAEIQACRLLTLHAAHAIDRGDQARVEIGAIKVVGARMLHNVIDRAIQAHGAAGLTDDTPLSFMYRAARFGRIYDGPDEVHVSTAARRILKEYRGDSPAGWEFGAWRAEGSSALGARRGRRAPTIDGRSLAPRPVYVPVSVAVGWRRADWRWATTASPVASAATSDGADRA